MSTPEAQYLRHLASANGDIILLDDPATNQGLYEKYEKNHIQRKVLKGKPMRLELSPKPVMLTSNSKKALREWSTSTRKQSKKVTELDTSYHAQIEEEPLERMEPSMQVPKTPLNFSQRLSPS